MVMKSRRMNRYNALAVAEEEYRRLNWIEIEGNQVYSHAKRLLLFHTSIHSKRLGSEKVVEKPKPVKRYFSPEERKIFLRWKKAWLKFCIIKWTGDVGNRYMCPTLPLERFVNPNREDSLKTKYYQTDEFIESKRTPLRFLLSELVILRMHNNTPFNFAYWIFLRTNISSIMDEIEENFGLPEPLETET